MPKISDILTQYNTDRETLSNAYKALTGKSLSSRSVQIKDEERAQLEPTFKSWNKTTKKSASKDDTKDENKVFKAEEVSFGDDFLSGLWFGPKDDEPEEDDEADEIFTKVSPVEVVAEEPKHVSTYWNARVISSAPEQPKPIKKDTKPSQSFERKESETRGKTFHKFSSNTPSFSKWVAKPQATKSHGNNDPRQGSGNTHNNANHSNHASHGQKSSHTNTAPATPVVKKEAATSGTLIKKQEIILWDTVSVKEFSEKMGVPFPELMKKFMANKILVNINSNIDYDTAALIGEEFNVKVKREAGTVSVEDMMSGNLSAILDIDKESEHRIKRAPVVTIMGHVDHGKTKLLDYLRKTNVIGWEAGGITQSIGASQILHNDEKITFIDTPGHQLFTSLRARGAKITNIVIIVIACDDGIKQQTVEAINHAKDAWVPIIVAITKIDKWINNTESIKAQMAEHGLTPEDWGGDVPVMHVSAVTGQGIPELLEQIMLQAEMLELTYNPSRNAVGVVLEVTKDPKQWVLTTILLMTGTMQVGDIIMIHNTYGKVRKILDWTGKDIKTATGGDPVMILGMQDIPEPGRVAEVVDTERKAQQKIAIVMEKEKTQKESSGLQAMMSQIAAGDMTTLKLIIKADSYGSLEAVKYSLETMPTPENINIKIIHSDVGTFWESDLALAHASEALIIGFNVPIPASIVKKADQLKVTIKTYDIIYEMNDYLDGILKGMIVIEAKEVLIGKLTVLGLFYKKEKEMIIGGKVTEGKAKNGAEFRIWRKGESGEDEIVGQGRITSLKRDQENVSEVNTGYECGMKVRVSKKVVEDDVLEFFVME